MLSNKGTNMNFGEESIAKINYRLSGGMGTDNFLAKKNVMAHIDMIRGLVPGSDLIEIDITRLDGSTGIIKFEHQQDCCENVVVDQVDNNVERHIGGFLTGIKSKTSNQEEQDEDGYMDESNTWTFYDLETTRGRLSFRWHGSSNGYYSEDVDIIQ